MSDSSFRIKKIKDHSKSVLGTTLDSVHQTIIKELHESNQNTHFSEQEFQLNEDTLLKDPLVKETVFENNIFQKMTVFNKIFVKI
jgi:hypothetical protein